MAETVEGSFELTLGDVARARLWPILRNRLFVAFGAMAVIYAGWLVICSLLSYGPSWELLPYVVLVGFWIFVPCSAWLAARQFLRNLAPGQAHQRLRISHDGLEQEDGEAFGRNSWETVLSADETRDAFYLRAAGPLLRLIPKRRVRKRQRRRDSAAPLTRAPGSPCISARTEARIGTRGVEQGVGADKPLL